MKQLTRKEKKRIIRKVTVDNMSVADIANEYGRSRNTIHRIVKQGSPDRKTKVDKKRIIRIVNRKPGITLEKIQALLEEKVSVSSISKCLLESGFVCQSKKAPVRERRDDYQPLCEKRVITVGKPRGEYKLDEGTKAQILNMVTNDPSVRATSIQANLGKHLSVSTINRFLLNNGFGCAYKKIPNRA